MTDAAQIAKALTPAQRRFLLKVPRYADDAYKPMIKLLKLNLIARQTGKYSGTWYEATDLGRAVAAELEE